MMHEFLAASRGELIERCLAKVSKRRAPKATENELLFGIPLFLDQLIETLQMEQTGDMTGSQRVSGASGGSMSLSDMGDGATKHGRELSQHGFTVDQVVHDLEISVRRSLSWPFERNAPFETDEFHTPNRCLDNAIADAVTEFTYQRDFIAADKQADAFNQRLGAFAHELRNPPPRKPPFRT